MFRGGVFPFFELTSFTLYCILRVQRVFPFVILSIVQGCSLHSITFLQDPDATHRPAGSALLRSAQDDTKDGFWYKKRLYGGGDSRRRVGDLEIRRRI